MIAPLSLPDLVAASRIEATQAAIIAGLRVLCPGVTVVGHPGKLDINDVLAKAIVQAPGIALGWSRVRSLRDLGGTLTQPIDWTAYVLAEDFADTTATPPRRVAREVVAYGIGNHLLRILGDPDASAWGLVDIDDVATEPPPEFKPVVTMKTAEAGTVLYAVTWSQALRFEGEPFFGGPNLEVTELPDGMEFVEPEGATGVPTELLALLPREPAA